MAKDNSISMAYRLNRVPKGMTPAEVYEAMLQGVRTGKGVLPHGLSVTWRWRNNPKQEIRSDTFQSTVRNSGRSRGGFLSLMERRLERDASMAIPSWREREKAAEDLDARRSAAAKRGWVTRRKNIELRRRREAALKGWASRRRKSRKGRTR